MEMIISSPVGKIKSYFKSQSVEEFYKNNTVLRSGSFDPVLKEYLPHKSVSVWLKGTTKNQDKVLEEAIYWLEYVLGAGAVKGHIKIGKNIIVRADYMCW